MCDVIIGESRVQVSREVLEKVSPVFGVMLSSSMKEGTEGVVDLSYWSEKTAGWFISVANGKEPRIAKAFVKEACRMAHMYQAVKAGMVLIKHGCRDPEILQMVQRSPWFDERARLHSEIAYLIASQEQLVRRLWTSNKRTLWKLYLSTSWNRDETMLAVSYLSLRDLCEKYGGERYFGLGKASDMSVEYFYSNALDLCQKAYRLCVNYDKPRCRRLKSMLRQHGIRVY